MRWGGVRAHPAVPALPGGRLRSRGWRVVVVTAVTGAGIVLAAGSLLPGRLEETPIANPFALAGPAGTVATVLFDAGLGLHATSAVAALVSLVLVVYPAVSCVPVSVAVAVLRYRLWDLDRLVGRTVTYTLVSGLLVLPYLLILPAATRLAAGSGSLAVAALTLAAAAAFSPLRRRVQALVDRRFNRRRYDAARTIEAFAIRLREQVDLDALTGELLALVDQTVQPTQAWLWLRPPAATRPTR
jgi:hypothetical protein